jgi:hypothetical protein
MEKEVNIFFEKISNISKDGIVVYEANYQGGLVDVHQAL